MEMIPNSINQGDSVDWNETESDYPASESWIIGYSLVSSTKRINFESTADVDSHSFDLTTTITSSWTPGNYTYQRYASDGTERVTLNNGSITINRDFLTSGDERSHARKSLDSIEAVLENRATIDQEEYSINSRSLKRMPIEELLKFRDVYRAEVAREDNAERLSKGLGTRQTIRVRF